MSLRTGLLLNSAETTPWIWPGVCGGPKQSNCHFPPVKSNHSLDLPQPVMSGTPKANLPALLRELEGDLKVRPIHPPPRPPPSTWAAPLLDIWDCNTCSSAELPINELSSLSHPLSWWWAEHGQLQAAESFLEGLSLGNWRSGEKETWRRLQRPFWGLDGGRPVFCCRDRAQEGKLLALAPAY